MKDPAEGVDESWKIFNVECRVRYLFTLKMSEETNLALVSATYDRICIAPCHSFYGSPRYSLVD